MRQYKVVPLLAKFVLLRQGMIDKNRKMIAKILGLLGKNIVIYCWNPK